MNEILRLIETVSPDDTAKLDEIDARVQAYIIGHHYINHESTSCHTSLIYRHRTTNEVLIFIANKYTRSRDALKAIRPEGWMFSVIQILSSEPTFKAEMTIQIANDDFENFTSRFSPTEELAELHAVIQAISHERNQS